MTPPPPRLAHPAPWPTTFLTRGPRTVARRSAAQGPREKGTPSLGSGSTNNGSGVYLPPREEQSANPSPHKPTEPRVTLRAHRVVTLTRVSMALMRWTMALTQWSVTLMRGPNDAGVCVERIVLLILMRNDDIRAADFAANAADFAANLRCVGCKGKILWHGF